MHEQVYSTATNAEQVTRALKWFTVVAQLLLRGPKRLRGGRQKRQRRACMKSVLERFTMWEEGRRRELVVDWLKEREQVLERSAARRHRSVAQVRDEEEERKREFEKAVERAMEMVADGQMGAATGIITSSGMARVACELTGGVGLTCCECGGCRSMGELRSRHPRRRRTMPIPDEYGQAGRPSLDCAARMKRLRRHKGMGLSRMRDDYIRALAGDAGGDGYAAKAVGVVNKLGEDCMAGVLPAWFYHVYTAVRCVPLRKGEGCGVRPVAVGECLRKLWWAEVTDMHVAAVKAQTYPYQVAVGVRAAGQTLSLTIKAMLEANPEFVVAKLDIKNFFNEMDRATMLDVVGRVPALRSIVPALYAELATDSPIHLGEVGWADFDSQEGGQQGQPVMPAVAGLYLRRHLKDVSAVVAPAGGMAAGQMDDCYIVGPADEVHRAIGVFKRGIEADECGLELVVRKTATWSPSAVVRNAIAGWEIDGVGVPVGCVEVVGVGE